MNKECCNHKERCQEAAQQIENCREKDPRGKCCQDLSCCKEILNLENCREAQ